MLWGIALILTLWARVPWMTALFDAALLHLALDFPLYSDDARMHFWPISTLKFYSPISYWESRKGSNGVSILEVTLVTAATALLLSRYKDWLSRLIFSFLPDYKLCLSSLEHCSVKNAGKRKTRTN